MLSPIWISPVHVWHQCHHVFECSWTRQSRLRCFSLVLTTSRLWRQLHVVRSFLSTSDLHCSRWQSGEICQVLSTGAFTLCCHVFMVSRKIHSHPLSFCAIILPTRLSARCLPSSRPGTASFRSCLSLPQGSLTRGRLAFVQEAVRVFFFSVFSISSARDDMFQVISQTAFEKCLFKRCWNVKVLQMREFVFCFSLFFIPCVCTVPDHLFGIRLGALEMCCVLVRWGCLPPLWITNPTNLPNTDSLCCVCFLHPWVFFFPICSLWLVAVVFLLSEFPCQAGYVNGNPSGSRSEIRSKRLSWRSGSSSEVTLLTDRTLWISLCPTAQTTVLAVLRNPEFRNNSILYLGNPRGLKIRLFFFLERIEAPLPTLRPWPKCNFTHPRQLSPFLERLELPYSNDEILSGYEEIVSSGTDQFTTWVKMHEILVHHMVDIQKATAEFRGAFEWNTCYLFTQEQFQ